MQIVCCICRLTVDEVSHALEQVLAGDGAEAEMLVSPLSPVGQETVFGAPPVVVPLSPVGQQHSGGIGVVAVDDAELAITLWAEEDESWLYPSPTAPEDEPHKPDIRAERFKRTLLDARAQEVPRAGGCKMMKFSVLRINTV